MWTSKSHAVVGDEKLVKERGEERGDGEGESQEEMREKGKDGVDRFPT